MTLVMNLMPQATTVGTDKLSQSKKRLSKEKNRMKRELQNGRKYWVIIYLV